jgi:3-phytase
LPWLRAATAKRAAIVALTAGALLATTGASEAATTSAGFLASADAPVTAASPTRNLGTQARLLADASPVEESLVKFVVSGVQGPVSSAKLRMNVRNGSTNGPAVYSTATGWTETGVTYATRPPRTSGVLVDKAAVATGWIEYDVTKAVTGNGTYSFAVVGTSSDGTDADSRETAGSPQLVVVAGTADPAPADTKAPSVSIASPAAGSRFTTAGTVAVAAATADDRGVTKVEFYDNGRLAGTEDTAPFSYSWAVSSADNGAHRWTAKAFDAAGNAATSAAVDTDVAIAATAPTAPAASITASAETAAVPNAGDAADDAAIWVHPTDPAKSTVIGTDKLGGLAVYDLSGKQLHYYADSTPNNVDIRYNFPLAGGRETIVTTSDRTHDSIRVYRVDPVTRGLQHISARTISAGIGLYGLCMYRSAASGRYYVFDSDSSGTVQQWELFDAGAGRIDARKVRQFTVASTTEGCVADDESGQFYLAEEDVGIWRYSAEPTGGTARTQVDAVGGGRLTADIEGLSLYYGAGGTGYLLASSQGDNAYAVYERRAPNAFVGRFSVGGGTVDGVTYTDGLDVLGFALGSAFPKGLFVAQDDRNDGANQNFKLVPWDRIAAGTPGLAVDTGWDPRNVGAPATDPSAPVPVPAPTSATYHVDAIAGQDTNAGTAPSSPWKTLSKATAATLKPGDRVLLARGQRFTGTLDIAESGTAAAPITVGAYGTGVAPVIAGASSCVKLGGSRIVVRDLTIGGCSWAGVNISGDDNVVEANLITANVAGIDVKLGADGNRILDNRIKDNNVMSVNTPSADTGDSGAFGILLKGDRTEVAGNTISGSDAFSYDYGRDGAAVEIYGAQHSDIHHNVAVDNDAFSELGDPRSADNRFAYNEVRSSLATSTFLVTRGAQSGYGPVARTTLLNNTVRLTGASSQGVVCHAGCGPDILKMRNNIVSAVAKAAYADVAPDEDYNLYFGGPVQMPLGPHSRIADPGFLDAAAGDLRLAPLSPAIDAGVDVGLTRDLGGSDIPVDGDGNGTRLVDQGAHERP